MPTGGEYEGSLERGQRYDDPLARVMRAFEDCRKHHDEFVLKCEQRYNAYRGWVDKQPDTLEWASQHHPPYLFQIVDTIMASLVDDDLAFAVKPRPTLVKDPEEMQALRDAAFVLENLLRVFHDLDGFDEKQGPLVLQDRICGLTVAKTFWSYRTGLVRKWERQNQPIFNGDGEVTGSTPVLYEAEMEGVLEDHPSFEVVDVRDFFWPEGARSIDDAPYLLHRVWLTIDEVERLMDAGIYDPKVLSELKETGSAPNDEFEQRSDRLFNEQRTKGRVEVLELWEPGKGYRCTAGNRKVLLQEGEWPFWHEEYPFIGISATPDLFTLVGVSDVELAVDLQNSLWDLMNARHDNLALINNAIVLISSDVADPDDYVFAPMERWVVDSPDQTRLLEMNPAPAQVSIPAEGMIKGDIQNVTGGMPFVSGASTSEVDQKTATGVSIITSLAQRRLQSKKQKFTWGYARLVRQQIKLIQQFMSDEKMLPLVGREGQIAFERIFPERIGGDFIVEVDAMTESLMRQERRAEAQAKLSLALQAAPLFAAMAQAGVAPPLNMVAFMDDFLNEFGIRDTARYYAQPPAPPQSPQLPAGGNGGPPSEAANGGGPPGGMTGQNLGITSSQAADTRSPSNALSQSPAMMMQRANALRGAGRNV
ncbi:MAG: hypothetical protein ABWZ18_00940 [Solirubrobacterales bacterium]